MAVVLPIVLPLITATIGLLVRRRVRVQRAIGVGGALALVPVALWLLFRVLHSGPQTVHMGGWPPGFAIAFTADVLSALLVAVTAVVAACGAVYSMGQIDSRRIAFSYFPLFHILVMGVCGAFLTGDVFNLFVWFEVMLIASFVLLAMGGERLQMAGAIKYVAINLISSAVFLVAVGILYAVCHSLSMAELPARLAIIADSNPSLVVAMAALFAVSFAIKAGLFPVFSWLPASYHTPPAAVAAVFAGLLTKVGVYAFLRMFASVFPPLDPVFAAILVVAGATMLAGVLGAVGQGDVRRILGFHIISQIGYIVLGVGLVGAADPQVRQFAVTAAVFYTIHHILVKTNLYFVAGAIETLAGTGRLTRLGRLAQHAPLLAVLFLIPALSLAGIPPLSGFWAKLATLKAVLAAGYPLLAAAALVAGLLTLVSMMKIWNSAFWQAPPAPARIRGTARLSPKLIGPMVVLAALTVFIGLFPGLLFAWAEQAAVELISAGMPGPLDANMASGTTEGGVM